MLFGIIFAQKLTLWFIHSKTGFCSFWILIILSSILLSHVMLQKKSSPNTYYQTIKCLLYHPGLPDWLKYTPLTYFPTVPGFSYPFIHDRVLYLFKFEYINCHFIVENNKCASAYSNFKYFKRERGGEI